MPTEVKGTLGALGLVVLTLCETEVFSFGASIFVALALDNLETLLFTVIAALAIRFFETAIELSTEAGTAEPRTLASRTFRKTGFEFTIMPRAFALLARFCGERRESTC
jgi:hypothetical protein